MTKSVTKHQTTADYCRQHRCRASATATTSGRSVVVPYSSFRRTENPRVGGSIPSLAIAHSYGSTATLPGGRSFIPAALEVLVIRPHIGIKGLACLTSS